jgi:hypothetical protein
VFGEFAAYITVANLILEYILVSQHQVIIIVQGSSSRPSCRQRLATAVL